MYKKRISRFVERHNLEKRDYGPYIVLAKMFYDGSYSVNLSEAQVIRNVVVSMKQTLFPGFFDKIFISHREKDKEQVAALINLLHAIGIPRPTVRNDKSMIFCTSHPESYIDNGMKNLEEIREQFNNSDHTFFILWYTNNYFVSQACLNEAGAIWATNRKYQEILIPGFDSSRIGGLMEKQRVWFRANDSIRLNSFKEEIESMFCLEPLTMNAWETARNAFIEQIEALTK